MYFVCLPCRSVHHQSTNGIFTVAGRGKNNAAKEEDSIKPETDSTGEAEAEKPKNSNDAAKDKAKQFCGDEIVLWYDKQNHVCRMVEAR